MAAAGGKMLENEYDELPSSSGRVAERIFREMLAAACIVPYEDDAKDG
jgi:hypothetical protein